MCVVNAVAIIGCGNLSFPAIHCLFRLGIKKVYLYDVNISAVLDLQDKIVSAGLKIKSEVIDFKVSAVNVVAVILLLSGPQSKDFIKKYADRFNFKQEKTFISVGRPAYHNIKSEQVFHRFLIKKKIRLLLGFGFEPGLAEALMAHVLTKDRPASKEMIAICSGLPIKPKPPLNYDLLFGDYLPTDKRIAIAKIEGEIKTLFRFDTIEQTFIPTIGHVEIYDDGLSPYLLYDRRFTRVKNIRQCTARWKGYCNTIQILSTLGFLKDDYDPKFRMSYKAVTNRILQNSGAVRRNSPDVCFIYIKNKSINEKTHSYLLTSAFDSKNKLTAMGLLTILLPCYLIKKQIQNKSDMSYGITYSHQIFEGEKFEKFMMFGVKNNYFKYEVIDG